MAHQDTTIIRRKKISQQNHRKWIILFILISVLLLILLFFRSSFSKVQQIHIEGNVLLSEQQLIEAMGIQIGDSFFAIQNRTVESKIRNLTVVRDVLISKEFPGIIEVQVEEFSVVALEWSEPKGWFGLLSNGAAIPYEQIANISSLPILSGWQDQAMKANLCQVLSEIPSQLLNDISEIRPIPSSSYRDRIKMYTRSKFEVISRISYLQEKIVLLDDYVYETVNEGRTSGRIVMMETNYWQPLEIPNEEVTAEKMNSSSQ